MGKNDVQFPDGMNSRTPKFTGWSVWINVINLRTRAVHIPWIHLTMWPFCESYKWRDMRGRVRGDLHGSICLLNLFFLFHLCMEEEKNGIWGWSCVKAEAVRLYCRLWLTIIMAWTLTDNTDTGSPSLLDARWIFFFQTSLKTHTFYPNIERIEMLIIWFCLPHW